MVAGQLSRMGTAQAQHAAGGVAEAEEFSRLRRRLQLTNLRIARLYLLLKGTRGPDAEGDDQARDPLEELYVTDQEFQQHLSALSGLPPTQLDDPDAAESLSAIDRAVAVLGRRIQAEDLANAWASARAHRDEINRKIAANGRCPHQGESH